MPDPSALMKVLLVKFHASPAMQRLSKQEKEALEQEIKEGNLPVITALTQLLLEEESALEQLQEFVDQVIESSVHQMSRLAKGKKVQEAEAASRKEEEEILDQLFDETLS